MAYTNTPEESTYRTVRFDLVGASSGRNGTTTSKDQRFVNLFPEQFKDPTLGEKKYFLRERPGMIHALNVGVSGTGRGIAYFNGYTFTAIGNKLYRDTTEIATLGNSTGKVGFTQFNGTYTALIALDGVNGYIIKEDNTLTKIIPDVYTISTAYTLGQRVSPTVANGFAYEVTTAGTSAGTEPAWPTTHGSTVTSGTATFTAKSLAFPTPHVPNPIFIDGYLFVADDGTDDIYNCNLEDPLIWTAGDFITAELYPDKIVAMAKNANYLVAIGEKTTEHFYDAANASGSPLQRNDSAVQQIGCPASESVVTSDGEVVLVGRTDNGGRTVWVISGLQAKEIGTPVIRQHLDSEGTSITSAVGFVIRTSGHKFYVLTTTTRTWVYDFEEQFWHEWSYNNDTTPFICKYACDHPDGLPRLLHPSNGNVLKMSDTVAHDAITSSTNTTLYCVATTDKLDFKSNNRKYGHRLSIVGDAPNGATDVALSVQWSDDDYVTWSTARTIQLHGDIQALTQLGMFRRRAFKFTYNQTYPLRLEGFELDINIGQN